MRKIVRRSLAVVAALASVAGVVAVTAPQPAVAVEEPPSDLALDRYSGGLAEHVYVSPRTPCPVGSAVAEVKLHNPYGWWNTYEPVHPDGGWDSVVVPFDPALFTDRTAMLDVICHPASGPATMQYDTLWFELKNRAWWWQPDNANQGLVTRVYHDLFGRDPDPVGLAAWTSALDRGTPRGAVANGITSSREFRSGLVSDAYHYYLGRGPDPSGHDGWVGYLDRGATIEMLDASIMASAEYFANANADMLGCGYDCWVRAMYRDVLGRTASFAEVMYWSSAMVTMRADRYTVAMGFLRSVEHLQAVVTDWYEHLLARGTDQAGRDGWVAAIQGGMRREQLVAGITGSSEYAHWGA